MGSVSGESLVYHGILKEYFKNSGRKKADESGYLREKWVPFPVSPLFSTEFLENTSRIMVGKKQMRADIREQRV